MLDARSTPSSYITVMKYDEAIAKQTRVQINPTWKGTVAVVQAEEKGVAPENGIVVSTEAVVQTSPRSSGVTLKP
jgi:hypothetical protein